MNTDPRHLPAETKWYRFSQNNSGGKFLIDPLTGVGRFVFVEAPTLETAIAYFKQLSPDITKHDFVEGRDCSCCGDRWFSDDPTIVDFPCIPYAHRPVHFPEPCYEHPMKGPFSQTTNVEEPPTDWA